MGCPVVLEGRRPSLGLIWWRWGRRGHPVLAIGFVHIRPLPQPALLPPGGPSIDGPGPPTDAVDAAAAAVTRSAGGAGGGTSTGGRPAPAPPSIRPICC